MTIETTTRFAIQSIDADAERGGWQATGEFVNQQEDAAYGRRAEIYFTPEGGGDWDAVAHLAMRGSILPQATRFNYKASRTQVTLSTTDAFLQNAGLQGIYFVNTASPANPHQIANMNLGKIIQHIIEQHCNVSSTAFIQTSTGAYSANLVGGWVDTTNIDTTASTSVSVYTVRASNSIWQSMKQIAANEFYVVYMDKLDRFNYSPHPQFGTLADPIMTLTASNIIGQPEVTFREPQLIDQAVLLGLTDAGAILTASYPPTVGSNGRIDCSQNNLRCNSQARLNLLAQRYFDFQNRDYSLRVSVPGAWGLLAELYDRVLLTYSGTSRNGIGLSFSGEPFFISGIEVQRVGAFGAVSTFRLDQQQTDFVY